MAATAAEARCFERLPDDDDECKDCDEALVRKERFANALTVLSRAMAAKDKRLYLGCEASADTLSGSQAVVEDAKGCFSWVEDRFGGATGLTAMMVGGWILGCGGLL